MSKEQIITCPHCGNKTLHEFKYVITGSDDSFTDIEGNPVPPIDYYIILVQCRTCQKASLFLSWEFEENPENLEKATLLYPYEKQLGDGTPDIIKKNYIEAKKIKKISPVAFAVLIRRVLEYMCIDKGIHGNNLKEKLDSLVEQKVIPDTLAVMANALRFLGNIGAHPSDLNIDFNEAEIIDDFFTTIMEYVYIAPEKIKKLREKIKQKQLSKN